MSRFAALLTPGAPAQRTEAAWRVEADLARRSGQTPGHWGEGGLHLWQGGGPEDGAAAVRRLGPLALAGDLALTGLPELRGTLAADAGTDAADLVLSAWMRWGEETLDRLNGAFAFVLWDTRVRRLTAVRDRFGIRPLIHAPTRDGAVFASDLSTASAALDAVPDIDRAWVADYLAGKPLSQTATAWQGVSRLPPGHLMTVAPDGGTAIRAWYRLEGSAPPDTGGNPGEALCAALGRATIEACAEGPTATLLSGGLDSSSLALLSVGPDAPAPVPRPALSLRYGDPAMDEGRYIEDVLRQSAGRLTPVFLPGEETAEDLFDLDAQLDLHGQPVFGPGLNGNRRLYRAVRAQGCRAVLDGHGGDEVIDGAFWNIMQVAEAGRWPLALSLAARQARFIGDSVPESLAMLLAASGRRGFGRLGRWALRSMGPRTGTSPRDWRALVDPGLAEDTRLTERAQAQTPEARAQGDRSLPEGMRLHAAMLTGPNIATALEALDRAAQGTGVTPRYPFFDHRVVELCIWQPDAAKIAGGRHRALLREAMRGVLPESVRIRRDKTNFLAKFWSNLRADPTGRLAAFRSDAGSLRGWVDETVLRADAEQLAQSPEPDSTAAFRLWRAVWLAAWLERPVPPRPLASRAPCLTLASDR